MIRCFPSPRPDELLYSLVARYQKWLGSPSHGAHWRHVWGTDDPAPVVDLPGRLGRLAARLPQPPALAAETFLLCHTTFPYYQPFLSREHRDSAVRSLLWEDGPRARSGGLRARQAIPRPYGLRHCPSCRTADADPSGDAHWRRGHQLAGVFVCPEHGTPLRESPIPRGEGSGARYLALSSEVAKASLPLQLPDASGEVLRSLAQRTAWLLQVHPEPVGLSALSARYTDVAVRRGWVSHSGGVAVEDLVHASRCRHGAALLTALGCTLDQPKGSWMAELFAKRPKRVDPLRHLLLLDLLDVDLPHVLGTDPSPEAPGPRRARPVRTGPCGNGLCDLYQAGEEPPATEPDLPHRIVVECPSCRFRYAYRPECPARRFVLDVGRDWTTHVRTHLDRGGSQKDLARRLDWEPSRLRYHLRLRGIPPGRRLSGQGPTDPSARRRRRETVRNEHRQWLRGAMHVHPGASRSELSRLNWSTYQWLRRHDATWLEAHLPHPRPFRAPTVDWDERDRRLEAAIPLVVAELAQQVGQPKRLTRTRLARRILGPGGLMRYRKERLPRTNAALSAAVDQWNQALLPRRLTWLETRFLTLGRVPSRSVVARSLGFRTVSEAQAVLDIEAVRSGIQGGLDPQAPLTGSPPPPAKDLPQPPTVNP